jgi:uncharacterized alkaline shock family protein YloU
MNTSAQPGTAGESAYLAEEPSQPAEGAAVPGQPLAVIDRPTSVADARERGRTTVSGHAVERIAARLTADSPGVGGPPRRAAGGPDRTAGTGVAAVAARLHGTTAVSLAVRCSVPYPHPVARSTEALRELLMTRVLELTGLRVQRVDINVTDLPTRAHGRRVE